MPEGEQAAVSEQAFRQLRVLIVEDNKQTRTLLRAILGVAGVGTILEAANGEIALSMLRENPCDIVFSDMAMAPMDGLAFTRALRDEKTSPSPFVPVIMITGHTGRHIVEQARDAGVTELLAKPVTGQDLVARITRIMENPRSFIRCDDFFGPDRRRRPGDGAGSPQRRDEDDSLTPV